MVECLSRGQSRFGLLGVGRLQPTGRCCQALRQCELASRTLQPNSISICFICKTGFLSPFLFTLCVHGVPTFVCDCTKGRCISSQRLQTDDTFWVSNHWPQANDATRCQKLNGLNQLVAGEWCGKPDIYKERERESEKWRERERDHDQYIHGRLLRKS